jgi:hypothetical protein
MRMNDWVRDLSRPLRSLGTMQPSTIRGRNPEEQAAAREIVGHNLTSCGYCFEGEAGTHNNSTLSPLTFPLPRGHRVESNANRNTLYSLCLLTPLGKEKHDSESNVRTNSQQTHPVLADILLQRNKPRIVLSSWQIFFCSRNPIFSQNFPHHIRRSSSFSCC